MNDSEPWYRGRAGRIELPNEPDLPDSLRFGLWDPQQSLSSQEIRFFLKMGASIEGSAEGNARLRALGRSITLLLAFNRTVGDPTPPKGVLEEMQGLNAELATSNGRSPEDLELGMSRARAQLSLTFSSPIRQGYFVRTDADCSVDQVWFGERPTTNCAELLLNDQNQGLPEHVCTRVLVESTLRNATRWYPDHDDSIQDPGGFRAQQIRVWHRTWPLPAGELTLRHHALIHWADPEWLPAPPIADDPLAEIGLWIERSTPQGLVQLLGTVKRDWELQLKEPGFEVVWFADPIIQKIPAKSIYRCNVPQAPQSDQLHKIARHLHRWYTRHVLGRRVGAGGRPAGPPSNFAACEGAAYLKVLNEMRADHVRLTYEAAATRMSLELGFKVSRQSLTNWISQEWLPSPETPIGHDVQLATQRPEVEKSGITGKRRCE